MTTPQHYHAERLAVIAQHLNRTLEATLPGQSAGNPYTSKEGDYIRGIFHSEHGGEISFLYTITAYEHTPDISVDAELNGIRAGIMVPGYLSADVIAHAAMTALRTTINAINAAKEKEA